MCLADFCSVREPLPGLVTFPSPDDGQHVMSFRLSEWRRDAYAEPPGLICASGVWSSAPTDRALRSQHREYCRVDLGRVRIADRHGRSWEFAAGEAFLLLRGFDGRIQVIESTRIFHITFTLPDASALDWCMSSDACTSLGQSNA